MTWKKGIKEQTLRNKIVKLQNTEDKIKSLTADIKKYKEKLYSTEQ